MTRVAGLKTLSPVLDRALTQVRRREAASRLLRQAAWSLLGCLSLLCIYLGVEKAFGLADRAFAAALAAGAAWFACVAVQAAALRVGLFEAAALADERLKARERLSSAVFLAQVPDAERGEGWAQVVERDSIKALSGVDLSRQFPVRMPRLFLWSLLPAAVAVALFLLPPLDLFGIKRAGEADAAMLREAERKRDELEKAIEELRKETEPKIDPELAKALEALARRQGDESGERKPEDLAQPSPQPGEEAKREALVDMARLEDALKQNLDADPQKSLRDFLDRFPKGAKSLSPMVSKLRQALKNAKFKEAAVAAKKMKEELESLRAKKEAGALTPEELEKLQALSDELARLGRDAESLSKLSRAFKDLSGKFSAQNLGDGLDGLDKLADELEGLEDLLQNLDFLEQAAELAELAQEDLGKMHQCPNCGKLSLDGGGG